MYRFKSVGVALSPARVSHFRLDAVIFSPRVSLLYFNNRAEPLATGFDETLPSILRLCANISSSFFLSLSNLFFSTRRNSWKEFYLLKIISCSNPRSCCLRIIRRDKHGVNDKCINLNLYI